MGTTVELAPALALARRPHLWQLAPPWASKLMLDHHLARQAASMLTPRSHSRPEPKPTGNTKSETAPNLHLNLNQKPAERQLASSFESRFGAAETSKLFKHCSRKTKTATR